MSPQRKLLVSLLVLLGVLVIGSIGFSVLEGASLLDSVYLTVITLSTVGYERPEWVHDGGKIWLILVIVFGVTAVAIAFSSLQAMVVGGVVRQALGRRKLETKISQLSGHVIVCGYGRMGKTVVEDLRHRNVPLVVIDESPERTAGLEELGILYVLGDATEEETLLRAGLKPARALVTLLQGDSDNVYVTLTARALDSDLMIVSRAEYQSTEPKLKRAGANHVITPQRIGATRVVNTLTRPYVVDFVDLAAKGVEIEMDQFEVRADSPICGKTLRSSDLRQRAQAMVVAIRHADGKTTFDPDPEDILRAGDNLIMLGPPDLYQRLESLG